uniref:RING-type domain-containing protein n=1 Tax=Strongyloides papillosus TaxID=174720 RepID=A0A0N5B7X9_STREA
MSLNECYWIRCNRCTSGLSQTQLYLTNCGHIFCLSWLGLDTKEHMITNPICASSTHLLEMDLKLGLDKLAYFKDPEVEFKEAKKKAEKIKSFKRAAETAKASK